MVCVRGDCVCVCACVRACVRVCVRARGVCVCVLYVCDVCGVCGVTLSQCQPDSQSHTLGFSSSSS